jgi:hypothetical protein
MFTVAALHKTISSKALRGFVSAAVTSMSSLDALNFDNRILNSLPVDKDKSNYVRTVEGACYSLVDPTPLSNPQLVSASTDALRLIGIREDEVTQRVQCRMGSNGPHQIVCYNINRWYMPADDFTNTLH